MNIFPSRNKQNISTDVYIDGQPISATRVDVDSLIVMPFPSLTSYYLSNAYGNSFCILYQYSYGRNSVGDGLYVFNGRGWTFTQSSSALDLDIDDSRMINYHNDLHVFWYNSGSSLLSDLIWNGEQLVENFRFNSVSVRSYSPVVEYHDELYIPAVLYAASSHLCLYKMDLQNAILINAVDFYDSGLDTNSVIRMVVYNDEIHILSGITHYKWNGTTLSSVSTIPIDIGSGYAVVWNSKIHIFKDFDHYSWNGTVWTKESDTMFRHYTPTTGGGIYNNKLYLLGGVGVRGIEILSSTLLMDVTIS